MTAFENSLHIIPRDLFDVKETGTSLERMQHLMDQCHPGTTGMQLVSVDGEQGEATIPFAMKNRALHGLMHGGCYFTVGDTLTALMSLFHAEKPTERMLTINASIRYLRPINRETVTACAKLLKKNGKNLHFVCDFLNPAGKRAAQGKYHYVLAEIREG